MAANTERTFEAVGAAGDCDLPSDARALAINVTAVNPGASGNFRLYSTGSVPLASALNFSAGKTRANNAIIEIANGRLTIRCDMPAGSTHVVVDVFGYFR
jgi:hypothetical protein